MTKRSVESCDTATKRFPEKEKNGADNNFVANPK